MMGRKLLHCDVAESLGARGMGEVYRARDTRLGRDVTAKVLPPGWTRYYTVPLTSGTEYNSSN